MFDNQIEHWLNGQKIVDAVVGSDDWHQRVEKSKFRSHEGFGQNAVGRIFLQDHGTEVWFRDIALTPLYNASVADSNPATGECNGTTV
ncbi:MAG: DUF1080 domain-containing protein, partial [Burkholderiales bacterium]|nr:DUF1080 domain-containing protein [Burkholderiales bacterium]